MKLQTPDEIRAMIMTIPPYQDNDWLTEAVKLLFKMQANSMEAIGRIMETQNLTAEALQEFRAWMNECQAAGEAIQAAILERTNAGNA